MGTSGVNLFAHSNNLDPQALKSFLAADSEAIRALIKSHLAQSML
jgi:hypothetical protein